MKYVLNFLVLGCLLLAHQEGFSQDRSSPGLIALLANPQRFDGKLVTVFGFLIFDHQKHHAPAGFLFLHEEDAKNLLPNGVEVTPSEQMVRDQEKINRMYVMITGLVRLVPGTNDSLAIVIKDVRNYRVWSDPQRPITLKKEDGVSGTDKK